MQAANEAELAAIRSRIEAALGAGVNEKRIADLLSLAQFQMLSRDTRTTRSPTVVLSMRPQRSTTLRCRMSNSSITRNWRDWLSFLVISNVLRSRA